MIKRLGCLLLSFLLITQFSTNVFAAGSLELLYNFGGSDDNLYTPEAYYVPPVIKDINKDGKQEIIFGNYSIIVLDAVSGNIIWRVNGGKDRSSGFNVGADMGRINKIAVEDIDGDGFEDIIAAHTQGTQLPAFTNGSLSAPAVFDVDGDGKFEIAVNTEFSGVCLFKVN